MDKTLLKLFTILFILLGANCIQAQSWKALGPDDNNEAFSGLINYNNIVASPDGVPYIVSSDNNNSGKLTVKKFDGSSWITVGATGFTAGTTGTVALAINGVTPYVAFSDAGNSGKATVMKFDGSSWATVGAAGFSTGSTANIALAFNGNTPYVTYGNTIQRFDGSNWVMVGASGFSTGSASGTVLSFDTNDIPYVAYIDYGSSGGAKATVKKFVGSTWVTVGTPATLAGQVSFFAFVFYGGTPFVAYTDANNTYKLSVKRFDGNNWLQVGNTNVSTNTAAYISIASNGTPYVAYEDGGLGGKATVKKYNGQSWVTVGIEGFSAGYAENTSIALAGSIPFVTFKNADTKKGTAMFFDGSNWVVAGSSGSVSIGAATFTSLAFNNDVPYLAYTDAGFGGSATVKKYDGSNWTTVGAAGFSAGQTTNNSLVFNSGTPYISYSDNANGSKATVMKFDGSNWVGVGAAGFSANAASYVSLAFNGTTPYVAYGDYGISGKVTVKKFDGSTWQTVGTAGFSGGAINSLTFGITGGVPYVAYADSNNGGKLTVMKFNGTAWVLVGTPNFSAGATTYLPIAFDGTTFYAAYPDPNAGNKLTVKKFDGSNWNNVGAAGLSAGGASYVTFAFNGNTPYVGYADASFSGKISVKQFDGNNWINVGTPGFSSAGITSTSTSLAVNNNKIYVAYDLNGAYVKSFANPMSTNAQLSNLALSSGTLAPAFAAGTTSYTASVPNTTISIALTPTLADVTASVTINGTAVTSGSASTAIPLTIGNNTIATIVTAQDGKTTQTYTLTVNRAQTAQTITFAAIPNKTFGDADFAPGASSSSRLAVAYTTSNPAVAIVTANGLVHLVAPGTATITASQVGNADFAAAPDVAQTLTVAQPANPGQVLTWKPLGPDDNNQVSAGAVTYTNIVTDANGVPYIAFSDVNNGGKVTVKRFDGISWVTVGAAGFSAGATNFLSLAINNSTPYIAYADGSNGSKATVKKFDGSSWVTVGTEGFSVSAANNTLLTFNGNTPYLSYIDAANGNKATVSKFDGSNWVVVGAPGFSSGTTTNLSLVFNGSTPYVAYVNYNPNGGYITVKRFDGSNWVTVGTESFSVGRTNNLAFGFIGTTPYVAYNDVSNSGYAMVMKFNGTSWVLVGTPGFSAGVTNYVLLAFNGGNFYAAYADPAYNSRLTVQKFDGSTWASIGTGISAGQANYTSFGFNGSTPYIAYADGANSGKAIVKKFNGSSWFTVGSGISGGPTGSPSLAFSGSTPYIAYSDRSNGGKATVKKYDGSNWVPVGIAGFTPGYVDQVSLAISNGTPYVFYGDLPSNSGTGAVMKFDGSNWVTVGPAGFKQTTVTYPSIKINSGVPYVVYQTGITNGGTIVVQKFNGTDWVTVGSSIAVNSNYPSLAFNGDVPYVVYADGIPSVTFTSQAKATVKKFDGINWVTVGGARFSSARIQYPTLIFNGSTPYVAYTDIFDGRETLQKFNGTNWTTVSTSGFLSATSAYTTSSVSLALVGDTPYEAYQDATNGSRATVSRFDGSNWITVGTPGVTAGAVNSTNLIANNNKLYLAYASDGAYVKYFDLPVSNNAQLANLTVSSGTLSPAFTSGTTSYTASVPNTTASITLTPILADATASVTVNGAAVIAGSASSFIPLTIGNNTITTVVTAQDGTTAQTYTLTVNRAQAAQTITFAAIPNKTYGDADFAPGATSNNNTIALAYTSSNPAVATVVDGKIHIVGAGTTIITANQPADATYSAATPVNQDFIVVKTVLTISAENKSKTYGDANPALTLTYSGFVNADTKETALTALPIASTAATATSPAGDYPITASGAAGNNYTFTYLPGTLTTKPAAQTITFNTISAKTFGDADFTLNATASSGLVVAYLSSDPLVATVDAVGKIHLLSAGNVTITASQQGDNNYNTATPVAQTLTVKQASQAITFSPIPTKTYGDADFSLTATSASGLPIAYTSSNTKVATVSTEGKVHIISAGTTTITASQTGNSNYSAVNATQNFMVVKAALTIKADNKSKTYGEANPALTLTYSGFVNAETQSVLTAMPVIATTATATTDAGTYPITVSDAASANYDMTYISGNLTITKAAQTVVFGTLAARSFGTPDFTPAATASSGLPVSFASNNTAVITVLNGQLHIVAPGTATITAAQYGNINYLAAAPVSQNIEILFSLPTKNFTVSATGESCRNSKNGEINITAASNQNYTATITVAGTSTAYPFTNQLSVKNLPAGIYPVCITVAGYPAYQQCFNVTVTQPQDLAVSTIINPTLSTLSLSLAGASSYNISLNGTVYTTTQSKVSLPLVPGKNDLKVSTSSICQGVYAKTIELPAGIVVYPNPVEQTLSLNIGSNQSVAARAEIYSMQGKMVYSEKTGVNQGNCAFDVPGLLPGNYVLKLVLDHSETRIKIIKK